MIRLNLEKFLKLQGDRTEQEMADYLGMSRTQLWRIKRGKPVGESVIAKFKQCYPQLNSDEYFEVYSVS